MTGRDRTEPLEIFPLESVDTQATSVSPEVPTLGEKEVEGMQPSVQRTGLPLPSRWATMDFDNPPSPPSSRKPEELEIGWTCTGSGRVCYAESKETSSRDIL